MNNTVPVGGLNKDNISARCKAIRSDFTRGLITEDEFQQWIARISLEPFCWDDFRPRPLPTPPEKLKAFRSMNWKARRLFLREPGNVNFFFRSSIKEFLDSEAAIRSSNESKIIHLQWMMEVLKDDPAAVAVIQARLYEFQTNFRESHQRIERTAPDPVDEFRDVVDQFNKATVSVGAATEWEE